MTPEEIDGLLMDVADWLDDNSRRPAFDAIQRARLIVAEWFEAGYGQDYLP